MTKHFLLMVVLCIALPASLWGIPQNHRTLEQQKHFFRDSLHRIPVQELSEQEQSLYWLNSEWLDESAVSTEKEKYQIFKTYTNRAKRLAIRSKCDSCLFYAEMFRFIYGSLNGHEYNLPKLPRGASKTMEMLWLGSKFMYEAPIDELEDSLSLNRLIDLCEDPSINSIYSITISEQIATHHFFPRGDFAEARKFYEKGIDQWKKSTDNSFWFLSREFPGGYVMPMQRIARCLMNIGLIEEREGNFKKAVDYWVKSEEIYRNLFDGPGRIWAFLNISKAYKTQSDYVSTMNYLDSALSLIETSHFEDPRIDKIDLYLQILMDNQELAYQHETCGEIEVILDKLNYKASQKSQPEEVVCLLSLYISKEAVKAYRQKRPVRQMDSLWHQYSDLKRSFRNKPSQRLYYVGYQISVLEKWNKRYQQFQDSEKHNPQFYYDLLNEMPLREAAYHFSKPFLYELDDIEFLLNINAGLFNSPAYISKFNHTLLYRDRSELWQKMGQYDSALQAYTLSTHIKDSIENKRNYIALAQADLKMRTVASNEQVKLLRVRNTTVRQQLYFLLLLFFLSTAIALLHYQRRKRDRIIAQRDNEVLSLKAETELLRVKYLEERNVELKQELKSSIADSVKYQTRNKNLYTILGDVKDSGMESLSAAKANQLKFYLKELSSEDYLTELSTKARNAYGEFYDALNDKLESGNEIELLYCVLIVMGYNQKDISETLGRSPKAIKSLRYRVRKKLRLTESEGLFEFLNALI